MSKHYTATLMLVLYNVIWAPEMRSPLYSGHYGKSSQLTFHLLMWHTRMVQ